MALPEDISVRPNSARLGGKFDEIPTGGCMAIISPIVVDAKSACLSDDRVNIFNFLKSEEKKRRRKKIDQEPIIC